MPIYQFYQPSRRASYHISFSRPRYIIERTPSPVYIRDRASVNHHHYHHDAHPKKHSHDHGTHELRFKAIKQELSETRKEKEIVDDKKKRAKDWEEYRGLSKESKELGEKLTWYERKLDEEWKKAVGRG